MEEVKKLSQQVGRTLHLTLKKKWFDMISAGVKKEEYREIKWYWVCRLFEMVKPLRLEGSSIEYKDLDRAFHFAWGYKDGRKMALSWLLDEGIIRPKTFSVVSAKNGYSKAAGVVKWQHGSISIGRPNKEWCDKNDAGKTVIILTINNLL